MKCAPDNAVEDSDVKRLMKRYTKRGKKIDGTSI